MGADRKGPSQRQFEADTYGLIVDFVNAHPEMRMIDNHKRIGFSITGAPPVYVSTLRGAKDFRRALLDYLQMQKRRRQA